jgi:hypothetical protein
MESGVLEGGDSAEQCATPVGCFCGRLRERTAVEPATDVLR